jgi:hypothetical protein
MSDPMIIRNEQVHEQVEGRKEGKRKVRTISEKGKLGLMLSNFTRGLSL